MFFTSKNVLHMQRTHHISFSLLCNSLLSLSISFAFQLIHWLLLTSSFQAPRSGVFTSPQLVACCRLLLVINETHLFRFQKPPEMHISHPSTANIRIYSKAFPFRCAWLVGPILCAIISPSQRKSRNGSRRPSTKSFISTLKTLKNWQTSKSYLQKQKRQGVYTERCRYKRSAKGEVGGGIYRDAPSHPWRDVLDQGERTIKNKSYLFQGTRLQVARGDI